MASRFPVRYRVAVTVATMVTLGGAGFVWHTRAMADDRFEHFKNELRAKKADERTPAEWRQADVEGLERGDHFVPLMIDEHTRLNVANLLVDVSYALIPVVFLGCLGGAYFFGYLRR